MRLKLSLVTGTEVDDLSVTLDAGTTVGQLSERLRVSHPRAHSAAAPGPTLCLKVNPGRSDERSVPAEATMGEAGIRSGDLIALTNGGHGRSAQQEVATLAVVSGPDAGKSFSLPHGTSIVGRDRDCDIRLSDPLVSKRHAKITVTDMIEVIDDNSANGVQVNNEIVERAAVTSSDHVFMGDTELGFVLRTSSAAAPTGGGPTIEFNRSPRLDPRFAGVELIAPEPPDKPGPQKFPWITILAPLLMGAILYSVTKNIMSILFIALSPIMIVGAFFEGRHSSKKAIIAGSAQFRESLRDLAVQLQYACDEERTVRRRENPSVDDVVDGTVRMSPMSFGPDGPSMSTFAQVRLGLGKRPSRNKVKMPETNKTLPESLARTQRRGGEVLNSRSSSRGG